MPTYRFNYPLDHAIFNLETALVAVQKIIDLQIKINEINRKVAVNEPQQEGGDYSQQIRDRDRLIEDRNLLSSELYIFANSHKASFTTSVLSLQKGIGKTTRKFSKPMRSVNFGPARIGWRYAPPRVGLADGVTEKEVVEQLNAAGFTTYTRGKTLNRKQLLKDRTILMMHPHFYGVVFPKPREYYFLALKIERDPSLPKGAKTTERLVRV